MTKQSQSTNRPRTRPNFKNDITVTNGDKVLVQVYLNASTLNSFLTAVQAYNVEMTNLKLKSRYLTHASIAIDGVLGAWADAIHNGNYMAL